MNDPVFTDLPYRPCVGIMLLNPVGRVFVGERAAKPGSWQMPQGGINPGEDLEVAFFREMREEIGTERAGILEIMPEKLRYDFPIPAQKKLYNGIYRGQEQTWIAARFIGTDPDICLNSHTQVEFSNWQWVTMDDLLRLIIPFKRPTYERVVAAFRKYAK